MTALAAMQDPATQVPDEDPAPDQVAIALHNDRYAQWLESRALAARGGETDQEMDEAFFRERELALSICGTPAPVYWITLRKLDVLKHELAESHEAGWRTAPIDTILLAGIEADLVRMLKD